jgi:hypothetical protein
MIFEEAIAGQLIYIRDEWGRDEISGEWVLVEEVTARYNPGLLHVCRESRNMVKKYYKLMYADRLGGRGFWMCSLDVLCFDQERAMVKFFGGNPDEDQRTRQLPRSINDISAVALNIDNPYFGFRELCQMGRPSNIYMIREGHRIPLSHEYMRFQLGYHWHDHASEATELDYVAPEVHISTYNKLTKKLVSRKCTSIARMTS